MLTAAYWFQPDPGPLTARAWLFYGFCLVIFIGCLIWSGYYLHRSYLLSKTGAESASRPNLCEALSRFELAVGLAGLLLVGARLALIPGWSARIWPPVMVGLALSAPLALYWSRCSPNPLDDGLKLLRFCGVGRPWPLSWQLTCWLLQLVGLGLWVAAIGWPWWWAGFLGALLLMIQLVVAALIRWRAANPTGLRAYFYVSPLLPLFPAYVSAGLYLLFDLSQQPIPIPSPPIFSRLYLLPFYLKSVAVGAIGYTLLVELFLVTEKGFNASVPAQLVFTRSGLFAKVSARVRRRLVIILAATLGVASLGWLALELFIHRTHGVTGTDPYGYVQVAVDLVNRGTPLHRFDLFTHITELKIPWAPVVALGYHLPINEAGEAASVWPVGMSVLLAVGYWLGAEPGLYLTGPLMTLLASLGVGWLTWTMANAPQSRPHRTGWTVDYPQNGDVGPRANPKIHTPSAFVWVASALGLFVWTTSFEVVDRSLVPLADGTAALFTSLIWIALLKLRAGFGSSKSALAAGLWLYGLAAGLALGVAFAVRYTQLLVVASILVGLGWLPAADKKQRAILLLLAGLAALAAALPDILYRWQVFGTILANPQRRELIHFAGANIIPVLHSSILRQLFHGREFGLLLPFLAVGMLWHWRRDRFGLVMVASGALIMTAFQLPYQALSLRDLLPLFPLLAAWSGLGLARLGQLVITGQLWPTGLPPRLVNGLSVGLIFLFLLLPISRVEPLITRTWRPHRASFGYVTAQERAALAELKRVTPESAAIGAQLNGGAIALHSRRRPFYPAGWSRPEFECFLVQMATDEVPLFLLDDSRAIRPAVEWLAEEGYLHPVVRLEVPLANDRGTGWLYQLSLAKVKARLDCPTPERSE